MPESANRKLVAILFADIAGYTALMQKDEATALQKLSAFKTILESSLPAFNGSLIQYYGDGCLIIFQSPVDALGFAIAVQSRFKSDHTIPVRIGIHSGDVVMRDGLVFGDAVNITSRIESMGTAGTILVSATIWHQVKNKPEYQLISVGKFDFKNVDDPIEVYALTSHGIAAPDVQDMKGKLKAPPSSKKKNIVVLVFVLGLMSMASFFLWKNDFLRHTSQAKEKSIAILPLRNLSGDKNQDYFAEGIVEAIYSKLAQIEDFRVTSMTSMLGYTHQPKPIQEIARELHVNHILEGSIARSEDQVQIIVRMVDATDDRQLWTKTYKRKLTDLFAIQNNIAQEVVTELEATLSPAERNRIGKLEVTDITAYDLYLSGLQDHRDYIVSLDTMLNESAIRKSTKAISLDPQFDDAFALVADCWHMRRDYGFGESALDSAMAFAAKALSLNASNDDALYRNGMIAWDKANYEDSKKYAEMAISISPNNSRALQLLANYYMHESASVEKSIPLLVKAISLDPKNPDNAKGNSLYTQLGSIYLQADLLDEAEALFLKALEIASGKEVREPITALGFLYFVKGDFKKSIEYRKQQVALTPEDFGAINEYAGANFAAGNLEEAESDYRKLLLMLESGFKETYRSYIFRHRLATILLWTGRKEEAQKLFNEHLKNEMADLEQGTRHFGQEYSIAACYAAMGNTEKAYEWLEKVPFWHITYQYSRVDPLLTNLRGEPRFETIMRPHRDKMTRLQTSIKTLEADGRLQVILEND